MIIDKWDRDTCHDCVTYEYTSIDDMDHGRYVGVRARKVFRIVYYKWGVDIGLVIRRYSRDTERIHSIEYYL